MSLPEREMPEHRWLFRAVPLRVVDGDTFHAKLDQGFGDRKEPPSPFAVIRLKKVWVDDHTISDLEAAAFMSRWFQEAALLPPLYTFPLLLETEMLAEPRKTEMGDNWSRFVAWVWRRGDGQLLNREMIRHNVDWASK